MTFAGRVFVACLVAGALALATGIAIGVGTADTAPVCDTVAIQVDAATGRWTNDDDLTNVPVNANGIPATVVVSSQEASILRQPAEPTCTP